MIVQDDKRKVNARWEEGRTRRRLLYALYAVVVLALSTVISFAALNRSEESATALPGYSTLPVISFSLDGALVNPTSAYTTELQMQTVRGTILPLERDRSVRIVADEGLRAFKDLRFEVRSADGTSLVENTPLTDLDDYGSGFVTASFVLKDLISYDTEYMLVILGESGQQTIRYYTRIICAPEEDAYHVPDKIEFVRSFHENSLDKERAQGIATYIESNAEGDNSSFAHVDIHSSFQQISYGDLDIVSHTAPVIRICDMQTQTGEFLLDYTVSYREAEEGRVRECRVQESYQVRYAPERIYLLEYERDMHYMFRGDKADVENGTLKLSISDKALETAESDGGNTFVFQIDDRLYAYNLTENKISLLYEADNDLRRQTAMPQQVKILQVDEASNVKFLVSGYLSRGRHEGHSGLTVYQYNAGVNTVEELLTIYSDKAPQILNAGIRRLSFVNQDEILYLMPERQVYAIDLKARTVTTAVEEIEEDTYHISTSGSKMIWQQRGDEYSDRMHLMDFNTQEQSVIEAGAGETIQPLGFMGEDIVYGLMRMSDVRLDAVGNPVNAMYKIRIQDVQGNVLEDYEKNGIYVTDARTQGNQLSLTRVEFDGATGGYTPTAADQIMDTLPEAVTSNRVIIKSDPVQKNLVEVSLKTGVDGSSMKYLTPGEIRQEERRVIETEDAQGSESEVYYVYDKGAVEGIYALPSDALQQAYDIFGVVTDKRGNVIWGRGNLQARNQIMLITTLLESGQIRAASDEDSLAACLELTLTHAGASRNVGLLLMEGNSAHDIIASALPEVAVLVLNGCRMQSTLYYMNRDLPVLAGLNNGRNILLIGFNERNVVIADPVAGTVTKMGMNDAASYLEQNGNRFLTYLPVSAR